MAVKRLTPAIAANPPGAVDKYTWDINVQGLGVRKGKRYHSFVIQYRMGQRSPRVQIGRVGHMTLDEARAEAQGRLALIASTSRDPGPMKKAPESLSGALLTVAGVIEAWMEAAADTTYRINGRPLAGSTLEFTRSNMRRIKAVWGQLPAHDLTTEQVEIDVKVITHGVKGQYDPAPALARNLLSNLRSAWRWARTNRKHWQLPDVQMKDIDHVKRGPKRAVRLTDEHYRAVLNWLADFHGGQKFDQTGKLVKATDIRRQAAYVIELMMYSGRRKLHVASLRTDMLFPTPENPTYIATDEKVAESGRIYFARQNCRILGVIREAMAFRYTVKGEATSPWLFGLLLHHDSGRREKVEELNKLFRLICEDIGIAYAAEKIVRGKLTNATAIPTPHDLRRGFANACYSDGMTSYDASVAGGWSGTQAMVTYYLSFDENDQAALAERRQALQNKITGYVPAPAAEPAGLAAMIRARAASAGRSDAEIKSLLAALDLSA